MKMSLLLRRLGATLLFALALPAWSAEAPDALVKRVGEEVQTIIREDPAIQAGDMQRSLELIDAKLLPHFDFARMTALAVGKDWRSASAEQKAALTAEFRTLLVRNYANALKRLKDYKVSFKPLKMKAGDTEVSVRTEVSKAGADNDSVDYAMTLKADAWKVYDVTVSGVSLITSYREGFAQEISNGGIDALIASLKRKNAQNAKLGGGASQ